MSFYEIIKIKSRFNLNKTVSEPWRDENAGGNDQSYAWLQRTMPEEKHRNDAKNVCRLLPRVFHILPKVFYDPRIIGRTETRDRILEKESWCFNVYF